MSASAIKPVHPSTGTQAPKVGSSAPTSGATSSPPLSATAGSRIQTNTTGSPVRPTVPPNTNHAVTSTMPMMMADHKASGNALSQPQIAMPRTPERNKEHSISPPAAMKPTSNGVEGSPDTSPSAVPIQMAEIANSEEEPTGSALQNHALDTTTSVTDTPLQQTGVVPTTAQATPPSAAPPSPTEQENNPPPPAVVSASVSNSFTNLTNSMDSVQDGKTSPPELMAPELVRTVSPANASTSLAIADSTSTPQTSVAPAFVSDSPPKLTVQADVTKTRIEMPKPEFKVATPPRNSKRKKETKLTSEVKDLNAEANADRKSKRQRTRTQPYQSPLPNLAYMTKVKPEYKSGHDKLIVFYKNEFLAVRNAEGGFYVCQAMQNIYKSSPRLRIRWLSQEKKDNKLTEVYVPDFYDATDFDCILTNLDLKKLDKNRYQLPPEERDRTLSILNRALDVEKGVTETSPITEEHPDGLDVSLYRDEAQLKKRFGAKRSQKRGTSGPDSTEDSEESLDTQTGELDEEAKKKKQKSTHNKKTDKSKSPSKEKVKTREKEPSRAERASERQKGRERGAALKRRSEIASTKALVTKPPPEKKAKITPEKKAKAVTAKSLRKPPSVKADSPIPTRSSKSRTSAKDIPKSSPLTRTKERERRGVPVQTKGRKKPGKRGKSLSE